MQVARNGYTDELCNMDRNCSTNQPHHNLNEHNLRILYYTVPNTRMCHRSREISSVGSILCCSGLGTYRCVMYGCRKVSALHWGLQSLVSSSSQTSTGLFSLPILIPSSTLSLSLFATQYHTFPRSSCMQ